MATVWLLEVDVSSSVVFRYVVGLIDSDVTLGITVGSFGVEESSGVVSVTGADVISGVIGVTVGL